MHSSAINQFPWVWMMLLANSVVVFLTMRNSEPKHRPCRRCGVSGGGSGTASAALKPTRVRLPAAQRGDGSGPKPCRYEQCQIARSQWVAPSPEGQPARVKSNICRHISDINTLLSKNIRRVSKPCNGGGILAITPRGMIHCF